MFVCINNWKMILPVCLMHDLQMMGRNKYSITNGKGFYLCHIRGSCDGHIKYLHVGRYIVVTHDTVVEV